MTYPYLPPGAIRVVVSQYLVGSKRAVKSGDTVSVSPAMWELMRDATQEELRHLLEHIEVVDIGPPPTIEELFRGTFL